MPCYLLSTVLQKPLRTDTLRHYFLRHYAQINDGHAPVFFFRHLRAADILGAQGFL